MDQRRLLITGGSGYLGSELVRQAQFSDWKVVATYHAHPPDLPDIPFLALDIRDNDQVARTLNELHPDVIIHTVYRQDDPDLWTITALGPGYVASAAQQIGARLIYMSSDVIFDGERIGSYHETDLPAPVTPYGEAKAAAERLVADLHPQALIVRTSLIYGGMTLSKHEQFVLDVVDGQREALFFTDELRCPVHVGDLASALLELAQMPLDGVLHVAGADIVSRYTFACLVAEAHQRPIDRLRFGPSSASGQRRPRNCALDISKAQRLLQTRLRGIREVLQPSTGSLMDEK